MITGGKRKKMEMEKYKDMEIDNVLIDCNQGIITQGDIDRSIEEYLNTLPNPDVIYINGHKSFNNLLLYLYKHCIKSILPKTYKHDYKLLDDIFINIYMPLTYRFNRIASVNNFCILINIDYSLFYDIKNGVYRSNDENVNNITSQIVKRWINICDGELIDNVMHTGNVGGMFVAKTRGFREEPQTVVMIDTHAPKIDAKQIDDLLGKLPELPE
jgi:hypothetical protein